MTQKLFILFSILLLGLTTTEGRAAAEPQQPLSAGGFTLGTSIKDYDISGSESFIKEVVVEDIKGFRKGFITYGLCDRPEEIVRIKLKYRDQSTDFFEQLLKRYKKKFGSKPKYVGDSFGNIKAWKWAFTGKEGKRTTLVLQHNRKDKNETIGNVVKLNLPDQLNAERECLNNKESQPQGGDEDEATTPPWDLLIPE
jgi:hypothetical protein